MREAERAEVVVVGNIGIDTCVYLYGDDIDWSVEGNFTENIDCVGQAGGYASRSYAALGRRTAFLGTVGDDPAGRVIREALAAEGIDARGVFVDPQGTARSANLIYPGGRRKNFYDGKGHMTFAPDLAVCREVMAGAQLVHVNIPNWGRRVLPIAREVGALIAVDLQDVVNAADEYRRDFVEAADYLFCSGVNHPDPEPLARALLGAGRARALVIGMGAAGCALATREGGVRRFQVAALELPVVDTNGAGDALAVGFLVSHVLEGRPMEEAVQRGQVAARVACAQRVPKRMISQEELEIRCGTMHGVDEGSRGE
ncbi:carbohydrate kinase family protein [Chondromyces apiculatus]|nr:carbohydrate kinase family protein [Chondromyces apiculatus]